MTYSRFGCKGGRRAGGGSTAQPSSKFSDRFVVSPASPILSSLPQQLRKTSNCLCASASSSLLPSHPSKPASVQIVYSVTIHKITSFDAHVILHPAVGARMEKTKVLRPKVPQNARETQRIFQSLVSYKQETADDPEGATDGGRCTLKECTWCNCIPGCQPGDGWAPPGKDLADSATCVFCGLAFHANCVVDVFADNMFVHLLGYVCKAKRQCSRLKVNLDQVLDFMHS